MPICQPILVRPIPGNISHITSQAGDRSTSIHRVHGTPQHMLCFIYALHYAGALSPQRPVGHRSARICASEVSATVDNRLSISRPIHSTTSMPPSSSPPHGRASRPHHMAAGQVPGRVREEFLGAIMIVLLLQQYMFAEYAVECLVSFRYIKRIPEQYRTPTVSM